ncbi:Z1 domain-containing protein [Hyphomonas sp.]|uniref:Z1 domain-containing protein n=1 Tax=Hyphomonas sp. TaxID=87 RepID=UPI0032EF2C0A
MTDFLPKCYRAALAAMSVSGPGPLLLRAEMEANISGGGDVGSAALNAYLKASALNDPLRKELHIAVSRWDVADPETKWADATEARTLERRQLIYRLLGLEEVQKQAFDLLFPLDSEQTVVISDSFTPWYSPEIRAKRGDLYYNSYSQYLADKNWEPTALASLDEATSDVVSRLSDPQQAEPYQSKGLVVGYVQSGKTANFTGVIAKSIDAGYRLIIVLTGTIDVLRRQTQRRIDMELVGKENILRGSNLDDPALRAREDYTDDPDWERKFVEYGFLPSTKHYPDIIRLTSANGDYKDLKAGIVTLEFEKRDINKPLWDPDNLPYSSARIAIVKKNKSVLTKLLTDIKRVRTPTHEIPTLIIDDESDQASINTSDPKKWASAEPERNAINDAISKLLELMPRAQYVGYTATPFANVFVDPRDAQNIFPKDFLVSLKRPPGYMGVADFHDMEKLDPEDRTFENSNEKALIRDATTDSGEPKLDECIDAFVLTGAVKLYRASKGEQTYRHHTMLIHESVKQTDHKDTAEDVYRLWREGAYSSPKGLDRLRKLYEKDMLPVCRARAGVYSYPEAFGDLVPYIGEAIAKITEVSSNPVIVVNGDKAVANEEVDFDKRAVWRILVGGTKLSRGFTVEGLTISYYRRKTKQADTLMQMGRWFGFREGYSDLVRLYVGRSEPDGKKTVDLYEAFEAIVKDEEAFRDQLRQYSVLVEGRPQITPKQIPPLVSQHLPWLRPAARNKMFNAEVVVRKSPGSPVIPLAYPQIPKETKHNYSAVEPLFAAASEKVRLRVPELKNVQATSFEAFVGEVNSTTVLAAIEAIRWSFEDYMRPDIAFLRTVCQSGASWLVIAPQTNEAGNRKNLPGVGERTVVKRDLRAGRNMLWGEPTDRKHRPAAQFVAGAFPDYGDEELKARLKDNMGAILIYPMAPDPKNLPDAPTRDQVVLALGWITPSGNTYGDPRLVQFRVKNTALPNAAIVSTD